MITKERLRKIAEKCLDNRADVGERVLLDVWLEEDEQLGEWLENEIEHTPSYISAEVNERLRRSIFSKLPANDPEKVEKFNIWKASTIVATIAMVFMAAFYFYTPSKPQYTLPLSVATGCGERSVVNLPDSTCINLNHESRFDYYYNTETQERTLALCGEATFDVATDPEHPFIVNCNGLRIECRGTTFNVNGYPDEKTVTVVLDEGIITAASSRQQINMHPGTMVTFNTQTNSLTTASVDAKEYSEWTRGYERFNNESLDVVARRLSRSFGAKIHFESPDIAEIHLTGTLNAESLDEALRFISTATGIRYRKDAKGVITLFN
ncbi:MAG: DUF4974 domain-containing protein [Bacteroides sp.]|nr:DUF4974 domain-containing protein [Bacteroides sp.]